MNDFSMLDEIEKYLLEIFGDKINALENKQRFYEKVLKKSDQLEGEEKIFFQIKMIMLSMMIQKLDLIIKYHFGFLDFFTNVKFIFNFFKIFGEENF